MKELNQLDWDEAKEHLDACLEQTGSFASSYANIYFVSPLIDRFEAGERSKELYDCIMQQEL